MSTIKQKIAIAKLVENGGNVNKAMVSAGYSRTTAKTPKKLTESLGWKELVEKYLSEEKLMKTHLSLLNSSNWRARANALDKAYKILGKYIKQVRFTTYDEFADLTDEELDIKLAELEEKIARFKKYTKVDDTNLGISSLSLNNL